jgi:hypothetical protein
MFFNQVFQRSASFLSTNTQEGGLLSAATTATLASEVSSLGGQSGDSLAEAEAKSIDGRRSSLPSVMVGDDSSLFKVLKDNMGKVCATGRSCRQILNNRCRISHL